MADDGKKGTFGRNLQKFISNNLPYRSPAAIIDDVAAENPKFKDHVVLPKKPQCS